MSQELGEIRVKKVFKKGVKSLEGISIYIMFEVTLKRITETMATKKIKTNEQSIKSLLKELGPIHTAVLAERMVTIANLTLKSIEENPKGYSNGFVDVSVFKEVCEAINRHLTDK